MSRFSFWAGTATFIVALLVISANVSDAQQTGAGVGSNATVNEFLSLQGRNPFEGGTVVDGRALRLEKGCVALNRQMDWSEYDFLKIDMELEAENPRSLDISIKDEKTEGYWTRVNYSTIIPSGKSTLTVPLKQLFVGEKSRPGRNLLLDKILQITIGMTGGSDTSSGVLLLSHFRLEKDTAAQQVSFEGLLAFDFGTADSPVMEGFTRVTPASQYSREARWGFRGAWIARSHDGRQPEPLYQDFMVVRSGEFAIDLPNGKYRVTLNIDSPGEFWGDNQPYTKRVVKINGGVVLEETLDFERFNKHIYRFWNIDDMPWENTFDKYQKTSFSEKTFDAEVTNGQLRIGFEGDNFGCCLSSMIVFPASKSEQGEQFIRYTEDRRRFHFDNYFKRVLPTPKGDPLQASETDKTRGYVLFQRDFMEEVNYNDTPYKSEIATEIHGSAFQGEYEPLTLSLVPLKNLGKVSVTTKDWQGPFGAILPASAIDIGYVSYRLLRRAMDGTVYTIAPKLILPLNSVQMDREGIARRFWVTVRTPADCAPGLYQGTFTIQAENGGASELAVKFIVRKGKLDDVDIPVGPFGHAVRTFWNNDAEEKAFRELLFDKGLRKLREYGFTSLTGIPVIPHGGFKDGKPVLDFQDADRKMKLLKDLGFMSISAYGAGVKGYDIYYKDLGAMRAAGFDDYSEFVKAIYSEVDRHSQDNGWIPVYYYLADEPVDNDIIRSTENAEAYRKAFPTGPPYFSGASSFAGGNINDPHYRLSKAFTVVSWNQHDEAGVRLLHEAGGHWAFYNGGNRWTFGDYMFKCVREFDMKARVSWHFNICSGNPYYALDGREDDYAWCNSSPQGQLIPSLEFERLREGIEDYRRLQTLERLAKEKGSEAGRKVIQDRLKSFRLGQREHDQLFPVSDWKDFRKTVDEGIDALQK